MISGQVAFHIEKRRNVDCKSGFEWAFNAQFVGHPKWTLIAWEKKPSKADIQNAIYLASRSFKFYHSHLEIPLFNLDCVDLTEGDK